jgi:hypothetical protein
MTEPQRWTTNDTGCVIDGHWGQYGTARMIDIAAQCGYVDPATAPPFAQNDIVDVARRHLASIGPSDSEPIADHEHEELAWTVDDVEMWMNEHLAPVGHSFGWHDGEFFLWADDVWQEM